MVFPAKRKCPPPEVMHLVSIVAHADLVNMVQITFAPAYRAFLLTKQA